MGKTAKQMFADADKMYEIARAKARTENAAALRKRLQTLATQVERLPLDSMYGASRALEEFEAWMKGARA